jgi:hypothetical protein
MPLQLDFLWRKLVMVQKTQRIWMDGKLIPWEEANVHIVQADRCCLFFRFWILEFRSAIRNR